MRKLAQLTTIIILLSFTSTAIAEKVAVIDTTGWTQEQKNMAKAALVHALHKAGRDERPDITKTGAQEYTLTFPDSLPNGIFNQITAARILQEIADIESENAAKEAAEAARISGIRSNIITNLTNAGWQIEEINYLLNAIGLQ